MLNVQGVMEELMVLNGDNAYNAHFGECISAIGDIDDDGYQGQIAHTEFLYLSESFLYGF